jgi:TBC1 domain family member 13
MDHPLSTSTESVWNTFFKDQEIWDEIEKDVKRTRSDMYYFCTALDPQRNISAEDKSRLQRQADTKKADLKSEDVANYIETHADMLHRILFIYAKLNPGIKYIQGMNEVLAVIYYCYLENDSFSNDYLSQGEKKAVIPIEYHESDLFFSFTNIMSEMKDGFLRELDKEKNGI